MKVLEKKYSDALVKAAQEVFETMIFMAPEAVDEHSEPPAAVNDEVIAVLGFTGTCSGLVAVNGSYALAKTICASMLGMDESEIESDEDIADSFGEMLNMVSGNFKNLWVEDGNSMDLSIPSVIFGKDVSFNTGRKAVVSYTSTITFEEGRLDIHLRFHE